MKIKNQKGFGLIEGLLVLVIIGMLVGIGWYVWSQNISSSTPTQITNVDNSNNEAEKEQEPMKAEVDYFEIKELGVKFELPKSLEGLYYYIGNEGRTAYFSLIDLKETDCAAEKTSQIALTRYTDADYEEDLQAAATKDSAKKINNFYFNLISGQAMCGDEDSTEQNKASEMKNELVKILPSTLVQTQ